MKKDIQHQLFFPHPPQAVWEYLINPDLMEIWLMKTDFKPVIGHEFEFKTNPHPDVDFGGTFYCKVLELVPLKKLSYSWQCKSIAGVVNIDSVVKWELQAKDNGTQLLLEHGDFKVLENMMLVNSMNEGWLKNMHKIADSLNKTIHGNTNS